jgi:hypothetical protein
MDLKVEVRAGGVSRASESADALTLANVLALADPDI